jgi:hypothetical protein
MGPSSYALRGMSDLLMSIDLYEVRPRKDKRSVDLISDALPFGRLWYGQPNAAANAIGYAMHCSRSRDALIYGAAGNVIETHEHAGDFQRAVMPCVRRAWRSSRAGVIKPLSGPAGLGDHGKPRVSQLQSRCSRAAKYAP